MANILVLNTIVPYPANLDGNSIRVLPLGQEISKRHNCFLAAVGVSDERYDGLRATGVYKDILLLPPQLSGGRFYRHFFPRTGLLPHIAHPEYYRLHMGRLNEFIGRHGIELVVVHGLWVVDFATGIKGIPIIYDVIDSRVLLLMREYEEPERGKTISGKIAYWRNIIRARYQEKRLTQRFRFVTTVSPIDQAVLQQLNPGATDRIFEISNGVSQDVVDWVPSGEEIPDSIAFWGALDWPPNTTAVRYFYQNVFLPYLQDKGVTWYIIGKNATPEFIQMAERHENIKLTGFVDDLYGLVSRIPITINPMQIGGGVKNKVLEAFGLERLVISTSIGMEALSVDAGKHYIRADDPAEFADQILYFLGAEERRKEIGREARVFILKNYTWEAIGKRFCGLIERALAP